MNARTTAASLVLAAFAATPMAHASETFLCADGRVLKVTADNRQAISKDPCVRAWFEASAADAVRAGTVDRADMRRTRITRAGLKR